MTERKRRAHAKTNRNAINVDDAATRDREISEIVDLKNLPNLNMYKKEAYSRNEQESSITALVENTSSDKFDGLHHPGVSSETHTFDDDYKKTVSFVRINEQPSLRTKSFRPVIFANLNAQDYLGSIQQTILSINESRDLDSFFEIRRADYHESILNTVTFWQKTLYNWLRICKDFNDYS